MDSKLKVSRDDIVMGVMDAYDLIEELTRENERLKSLKNDGSDVDVDDAVVNQKMLEVGRDCIVDKALGYWRSVRLEKDEDGNVTVQSFDEWKEDRIENVPKFMSYDQFVDLCGAELFNVYAEEKEKAISKEKENDDD